MTGTLAIRISVDRSKGMRLIRLCSWTTKFYKPTNCIQQPVIHTVGGCDGMAEDGDTDQDCALSSIISTSLLWSSE